MGTQKIKFLACLSLLSGSVFAASEVRLQPTAPTPEVVGRIGSSGSWAASLGVRSIVALKSPFKSIDGTITSNFRFQTSTGFGLEISHTITDNYELGVATGFMTYEARSNNRDLDYTQFETVRVRQFPIEVIGRYRSNVPGWAPEAEAGLGFGFGSIRMTSTNVSFGTINEGLNFLKGHLAAGFGYPWSDDVSFHLKGGYGIEALGSKTYAASSGISIQRSAISGVFFRGDMRVAF